MQRMAKATEAKEAYTLVEELQGYFVTNLDNVSHELGERKRCEAVEWLRDEGRHGGGVRYETRDESVFNRGSVNISQVHYDDMPQKRLGSATAISTIIHPQNPHAPSMHMHISWTQMRDGSGYWRLMADLNPSLKNDLFQKDFDTALQQVTGSLYEEGAKQGECYFYIPVLARTRGVSHFYLEGYHSGDFHLDLSLAHQFGKAVIDVYTKIIVDALQEFPSFSEQEKLRQLDYHTLYFFQVLTLDRGTTSGLMVHDQNDIGIMGSLPSHVNRSLLYSWLEKMPKPQDRLLLSLMDALPEGNRVVLNDRVKKRLANALRAHYRQFPEALSMQASGTIIPPTVENHR